jgi:hypothetical protein
MSRKAVVFLVALILTPVIVYFLWPSDESRIKKLFREGARAVEQENIDDVMAKVSFNYTDEYGLTYLYLKEAMVRAFQRMDNIKVEYEIIRIDIRDTAATVELDIRVIASHGSDTGYAVGDAARPAHMTFLLDKERTTWLVISTKGLPLNF